MRIQSDDPGLIGSFFGGAGGNESWRTTRQPAGQDGGGRSSVSPRTRTASASLAEASMASLEITSTDTGAQRLPRSSSKPLPPSPSPSPFASLPAPPTRSEPPIRIKSIAEIIAGYSGGSVSRTGAGQAPGGRLPESPTPAQIVAASARSRESSDRSVTTSEASGDELDREISAGLQYMELHHRNPIHATPLRGASLHHSSSPMSLDDRSDTRSTSSSTLRGGSASTPVSHDTLAVERELAILLKSPRLTRLVTLEQAPNEGLVVSLADVGVSTGHPVLVFLGLGCVRWLIALYDELAASLGLRLICLDRWGLGKTSEVPDSERGFLEWASVVRSLHSSPSVHILMHPQVEEVTNQLGIARYSILAHSAGAPYALATSLRDPRRVRGAIHLLAPWVPSSSAEGTPDSLAGAYKYIKYVPSVVIRTSLAAESKMMGWKLGKPPSLVQEGVGYDRWAPVSSEDVSVEEEGDERGEILVGKVIVGVKAARSKSSFLGGLFGGGTADRAQRTTQNGSDSSSIRSDPSRRLPSTPPTNLLTPKTRQMAPPSLDLSRTSARRDPSSSGSSSSPASPTSPAYPSSALSATDLSNGLLRASHAESLRGTTSDLLVLLDRTAKSWGFKFSDVKSPVKIVIGDKDERIGLAGVKALEGEMERCTVEVVEGADHSLMTGESHIFSS